MEGYLGDFRVDVSKHPVYSKYTPADWAMVFVEKYGGIDGDHHKTWVLDQVARCLKGTAIIVVQARWSTGQTEDRIRTSNATSKEYKAWVKSMTSGVNVGYEYDTGIAP